MSCSKQRHNKLWRSHSDGDLSEPLAKAPQNPLDRLDPHNNNNNGPASLQQFLGMAVLQALKGKNEVQQDQLDDDEDDDDDDDGDSAGPRTRSPSPPTSNGLCDSEEHLATSSSTSVSMSVSSSTSHAVSSSSAEDPFLPPLPRPRAATVVPKAHLDVSELTVAETVPAARPHPPPSLHVLPPSPSPEPRPDSAGSMHNHHQHPPSSPTTPSPDPAEPSLDEVDGSADGGLHGSTAQLSYQGQQEEDEKQQRLEAQESSVTDSLQLSLGTLSEGLGVHGLPSSSSLSATDTPMAVSPLSPSGSTLSLSLSLDPHHGDEDADDNNNNNTQPQPGNHTEEAPCGSLPEMSTQSGSSSLSTDSIDFFSAREKFLGLAQDGTLARSELSSSPRAGQTRSPCQEQPPLPPLPQDEHQPENCPAQSEDSQRKVRLSARLACWLACCNFHLCHLCLMH